MSIECLFFELLQVAIGNRSTLSVVPTKAQWAELFALSKKQALTAVAFVGVTKLRDENEKLLNLPEMTYLKWLGLTAKIVQRNKDVSAACVELVKQYAHDGIATCILKGQGNLEYYPEDLKECRTPGDIDVWCKPPSDSPLDGECGIPIAVSDLDGKGAHYECYSGIRGVIEYVKMLWRLRDEDENKNGNENERCEIRYHHLDAPSVNGVQVEAHFRPLFLDSPLRNWRLQRWFRENEQFGLHDAKIGDNVFPTPTVSFNAVYQLCHIYRHLFDEGIGLRQLLDYYFVLRALHIEQEDLSPALPKREGEKQDHWQSMAQWAEGMGIAVKSNEEIMHTLGCFGMKKFAGAVMYVIQTVLDPSQPSLKGQEIEDWQKRWPWMICAPNEKEGKFLLNEIMLAGNFGKYDPRIVHNSQFIIHNWEKLKHNMRLLTHYPEEVICEPFFRVYHWLWRRLELWRY